MDGLVVDNFAGGGGASTGIAAALGRPANIAVNHSAAAIAMHKANHPETKHYQEDVWQVDPREACGSNLVAVAWFSPDCTHFSRAKGGQPRSKDVRCLADVVIRWAREVRPKVIFLENVEEFLTWGPLDDEGQPIKAQEGEDFRAWRAKLVALGYVVEHRIIVAADHGTPTTRKRLFLVARCDGRPIVWPTATHGRGRPRPWRTAAEVIDWELPCPSIFDRKRPLAEATLRRIAAGVRRYVIESGRPFVVPLTHHSKTPRVRDIHEPFKTITAANRGELALVSPFIAPVTHTTSGDRVHRADEPLRTVTTAKGGEFVLVAPTMVQTGYGEREGQAPRALDIQRPLGTVVSGGKHALVATFLAKHYGGVVGHGVERPIGTVTAQDHHSLVQAQLELPAMQASFVSKFYGTATGASVEAPLPTVTSTGQHLADVRAFLVKYYGADGAATSQQSLFDPLHTVTTKARFGLVTVHGQEYVITDIGMRMLAPHELFAAQGFPGDYIIDPELNGRPLTKTQQIELAGNSVCPQVAAAIVGANTHERWEAVA
jgi:DNA (cytosine-5)-methyltransferase 1